MNEFKKSYQLRIVPCAPKLVSDDGEVDTEFLTTWILMEIVKFSEVNFSPL